MDLEKQNSQGGENGYFVTTRWSIIIASQGGRTEIEKARDALGQLCKMYWRPVHDFIRRKGYQPHDAQDLVQDFFMKIVTTDFLQMADRERGKFRGLLLTSLQNFLADVQTANRAQKRGGNVLFLESLDDEEILIEEEPGWTPERMFDIGWAVTVSKNALGHLRDECVRAGREKAFTELSPFLSVDVEEWDYQKAVAVLGIPHSAVSTLVNRLRERYRTLLRSEVAETVNDKSEIEEELRYLHRLLAKGGTP